jgi:hypothetical protein
MPLTGEAGRTYHREYMRRRREQLRSVKPGATTAPRKNPIPKPDWQAEGGPNEEQLKFAYFNRAGLAESFAVWPENAPMPLDAEMVDWGEHVIAGWTSLVHKMRERMYPGAVKPGATGAAQLEIEELKAKLAAANAKIATLLTLQWDYRDIGDGRYFSQASTLAGDYAVYWTALNKPRGGGENRRRPLPEGESFEASFSPWGKNNRRLKDRPLGTFATLDDAQAACQEHARAVT